MFVGAEREQVVDLLAAEWARVRETGRARLVLIEAETGWGKTRIVQEFYARLAADQPEPKYWPPSLVESDSGTITVQDARKAIRPPFFTPDSGARPGFLWLGHDIDAGDGARADMAIDDLSNQITAALERDIRMRELRAHGVRLLFSVSSLLPLPDFFGMATMATDAGRGLWRLRSLMSGGSGVGIEAHDEEQLAGFVRVVGELWGSRGSGGPPTILALEDGHAARGATLDLCRSILASGSLPFLIVVCAQPRRPRSVIREVAEDLPAVCQAIGLEPLTTGDLSELLAGRVPVEVADDFVDRVDGNPYELELMVARCQQVFGPDLVGITEQFVRDLPSQISGLLEALWHGLTHDERSALSAFSLLGPRSSAGAVSTRWMSERLARDVALRSGWLREQPDLLRFLEVARWEVAHRRASDAVDREFQRELVMGAVDAVCRMQDDTEGSAPLLDEMLAFLAEEAIRLECDIDVADVGGRILKWADALRWSGAYDDARRAAMSAQNLAFHGMRRAADRRTSEALALEALTLLTAVKRITVGRGRPAVVGAAAELEAEARDLIVRRPDLAVLAMLEVQRCLREPNTEAFDRARAVLDEATVLAEQECGHDRIVMLLVRRARYPWLSLDGDRRLALAEAIECHAISSELLGPFHPRTIESLGDAGFYAMRVEPRRSVDLRRAVLRLKNHVWGTSTSSSPAVALAEKELAAALVQLGDIDNLREAVDLADHALDVTLAHFGQEHPRTLRCMGVAALARCDLAELVDDARAEGLRAEALDLARRGLNAEELHFPERSHRDARERYGVALEATGDASGLEVLRSVLEERLAVTDGELRPPTAEARWTAEDLARGLRRRGRDDEAVAVLAEVEKRAGWDWPALRAQAEGEPR